MIRRTALGVAVALIFPTIANAAPNCSAVGAAQGCTCVTELVDGSPIAELTDISGDVKKTQAGAYAPAGASAAMTVGDGVLIGAGSAKLTSGPSCQMKVLGAQTSIVAGAVEGCGCVWVTENKAPPPSTDATNATDAILTVDAAAAAALIVEAQKDQSGPISP